MRAVFVILILIAGLSLCFAKSNKGVRVKHHKHCHKWLILQKYYILAFLAIKFKAILIVGSIWAVTFMFGKVFAALKLAEYMKKGNDNHEIIYSNPHHYDHESYAKSIYESPPSPNIVFDQPPKDIEFSPDINYSQGPPPSSGYGRSHSVLNNTETYEHFNIFFDVIKRSNLTEAVFKEMELNTEACKKKFVCEADFNAKQISILDTVFNMFIDDSYQRYRSNDNITTVEDCSRLNPTCDD